MRARIALLLVVPALAAVAPSPAHAATARYCHGKLATIVGTSGNDTLSGKNPLGDVVWLGPGNDSFTGLGGNDTICGRDGRDAIYGGGGNDWIDGGAGKDLLFGGDGNDIVRGGGSADVILADAGDDTIIGGGGKSDTLSYGGSTESITVDGATRTVQAGVDGTDTYSTDVERVVGTQQADTMLGGDEVDWFDGLSGGDTIKGGGGDDVLRGRHATISGGDGDDLIRASGGTVHGGAGGDWLRLSYGSVGYGDAGADLFFLGAGRVTGFGGPDVDTFAVRAVKDAATIAGGGDGAVLTFRGFKRAVTVRLDRGTASWQGGSVRLSAIPVVRGTGHADVLVGSGRNDQLYGGGGDDRLMGGGGNDLLIGQAGRDYADGGAGGDVCVAEVRRRCEA
ncbi:MAG TPA: calcium-binding protein [Nocardioides sp.]|nr:calcium-binding protein [Nocardioides sp.]